MIWSAYILGGILLLYAGAEMLIRGASHIAFRLGVPSLIIGLTIVSMGTSLPETVTTFIAQWSGNKGDLALGNVIGSNIANIGLIVGISALVQPLAFSPHVLKIDLPLMILAQILLFLLMIPGALYRLSGLLMVALMIAYVIYRVKTGEQTVEEEELAKLKSGKYSPVIDLLLIIAGLIALIAGGNYFVKGAVHIATQFQISERVIGLTIVAVGTSLPELAITFVAALRKHTDIAIGNIVGSSIFNTLFIAGGVSLLLPIHFSQKLFLVDVPIMIGFCLLLWFIMHRQRIISRLSGAFLLLCYVLYVCSMGI